LSRNPLEQMPAIMPETSLSLSGNFYNDSSMTSALSDFNWKPMNMQAGQDSQIVVDNPYGSFGEVQKASDKPLLGPKMTPLLEGADRLTFSTPADNQANGEQPDFRLVQGTDGQLRMEPVGDGDPLSDGKLNVEVDPQNKSLQEALKNADKNMKEYVREMMAYWQQNHPGKPYPGWWNDILNSQPNIPDNPAPVPVEQTPPAVRPQPTQRPEPPAPPKEGWQPDYRGGGGRGYGGGGGGGGGGGSGGGGGYYGGGGGDGGSSYEVPGTVPDFNDSNGFIDKLAKTVMANEGALNTDGSPKFEAYNPDDNGGISVGLRQWHAGGALPELLNAWQDKNPEKFQEYFKGYSPAQINEMSSKEFASHPELVTGMKQALGDKEYQGVQLQLINDWVKREVKMGMDMGLTGETELAVFVDVANQYGQSKANQIAGMGRGEGDQGAEMNAAARGGNYSERMARIDQNFSTQVASLEPKTPSYNGEFATALCAAIKNQDANMDGTGWCARAVQRALANVGLEQFLGSGNGWQMLGPLQRSGLFERVSEADARPGDLIVRPPSANPNDTSVHGDISVVTARNGDRITQTNDATYDYRSNNHRYDGKAVFLRYVGDRDESQVAKNDDKGDGEKKNSTASADNEASDTRKKTA
jgi:hypothetical protein